MYDCENIIEATGKVCGANADGPFHVRFCSDECADRVNAAELAELGFTTEMMSDALKSYYEIKEQLDQREPIADGSGPGSRSLYQSFQDESDPA